MPVDFPRCPFSARPEWEIEKKRGWRGIPIFLDTPDELQRREENVSASRHGLIENWSWWKGFWQSNRWRGDQTRPSFVLFSPEKEFVCIWCTAGCRVLSSRKRKRRLRVHLSPWWILLLHSTPLFFFSIHNRSTSNRKSKADGRKELAGAKMAAWVDTSPADRENFMYGCAVHQNNPHKRRISYCASFVLASDASLPLSIIPRCGQHTKKVSWANFFPLFFFSRIVRRETFKPCLWRDQAESLVFFTLVMYIYKKKCIAVQNWSE